MVIKIDEKLCKEEGLTPYQALLIFIANKIPLPTTIEDMTTKEMLHKIVEKNDIYPTKFYMDKVDKIFNLSKNTKLKKENFDELASELQSLFPKGKKPGTNAYWRGNKQAIVDKLHKFFLNYGEEYSKEDIIKATKYYIKSFKGRFDYMRILPYFIFKNEVKGGSVEAISELANILENTDLSNITVSENDEYYGSKDFFVNEVMETDWTSTLS